MFESGLHHPDFCCSNHWTSFTAAHKQDRGVINALSPKYVSFVNKAILWDRGLCHYTDVGASGEKSPGPLGLRGPVKGGHCLTIESRKLL
ncbi:hypothetical protein NQZ68_013964 [Dissostichus eleginoides]|nr:hypothetical protein NQZ68_013964 [Dissostichus eleginoides]